MFANCKEKADGWSEIEQSDMKCSALRANVGVDTIDLICITWPSARATALVNIVIDF